MKNKSILSVFVCLLVILGVFAGCSKEETPDEPSTEEITTAVMTEKESESEDASQQATSVPTTAAGTTTADPTTAAVTTTKAPETQVTTTKTPTTAKPDNAVSVDNIAASIASHSGWFEESLSKGSSARALSMFGISSSDVAEASYYTASAAVAEEVLVVKASSSSAVSSIVSGMESRKASQIEDYADYVPKEVPKLESAVIYTSGDYVVFCVSNNNSAAKSAIAGLF